MDVIHIIRHNEFVVNILEGSISKEKGMGKPRLQHLKRVARNTEADSYTTMERTACNKHRSKDAKQSKDLWGLCGTTSCQHIK
jgi:hypothetical protein